MSLPQISVRSNSDLNSLLAEIAAGSQQAMTSIYDRSNKVVFGLLLRILNDHATAEEVLLDVYMQIWRQAKTYDVNRGSPLAWILTIARSRAIDRLRSNRSEWQRRDSFDGLAERTRDKHDVEKAAEISEIRHLMRRALETLPDEQREVIEFAYYAGLSQSEIALKLNQPLGTVKTRTRLGMMKLREVLQAN